MTQAAKALVRSVEAWNTSYIAGIVGVRFIHEALATARPEHPLLGPRGAGSSLIT